MNFERLSIRQTERKEDCVWTLQRERERECLILYSLDCGDCGTESAKRVQECRGNVP